MVTNFKSTNTKKLFIISITIFCFSIIAQHRTLKDFPRINFSPPKQKMTNFSFNEFSQFGEDGIIEKIFKIIGTTSKIAVEFGGHDGLFCSNVARLWKKGWKAILIEGDKNRFQQLVQNTKSFDCINICEYVGTKEHNNIEAILKRSGIHEEIDLLSIDIDGNDYYIFDGLQEIRPRVIIVEYNPILPAVLDLYQPYDPKSKATGFGASVGAIHKIGKTKGYSLVAVTICNCIFVRNDSASLFDKFETSLREIQFEGHLKYLITTYSGERMIVGAASYFPFGLNKEAVPQKLLGKICKFPYQINR